MPPTYRHSPSWCQRHSSVVNSFPLVVDNPLLLRPESSHSCHLSYDNGESRKDGAVVWTTTNVRVRKSASYVHENLSVWTKDKRTVRMVMTLNGKLRQTWKRLRRPPHPNTFTQARHVSS